MSALLHALIASRGFIEKGWTQGDYARDKDGYGASADYEGATCWCAVGAIEAGAKATAILADGQLRSPRFDTAVAVCRTLSIPVGRGHLIQWNDQPGRTKQEVLDAFDDAIAAERKRIGDEITLDTLVEARKLIELPENWIKGRWATTKDGKFVDGYEDAACFCSFGALAFVCQTYPNKKRSHAGDAITKLNALVPSRGVIFWQDLPERTHAEVLELWDRAIAAQRKLAFP